MLAFLGLLLGLPIPQDPAQARLADSPRHHEWVDLESGGRKLHCFLAFPEVKDPAPVVLVIHENKGLTDWVRSVADQLAEAGYLAVAPDLLSGMGPAGGNTDAFTSTDAATAAIYKLEAATVLDDLNAVADHVLALPAAEHKLFVAGFCWGGSQSFLYATAREDLSAAFVFYGSAPKEEAALKKIRCPVYGFYGELDARISAGLPQIEAAMKAGGKTYEPMVYAGAGHGFMRAGEAADASEGNKSARAAAWERWKKLLATKP